MKKSESFARLGIHPDESHSGHKAWACYFEIPVEPMGKGRHRTAPGKPSTGVSFASKSGSSISVGDFNAMRRIKKSKPAFHMHEDPKTKAWEDQFAEVSKLWAPVAPIDSPVIIDILAIFSRPGYMEKSAYPDGLIWHPHKPDKDNVTKIVLDAMKKGGWFTDDCRVTGGETRKFYAERGAESRVCVRVHEVCCLPKVNWARFKEGGSAGTRPSSR